MDTKLYNELFNRMDELGAIRKDLSFGCWYSWYDSQEHRECYSQIFTEYDEVVLNSKNFKIIGHPPVLSDVIQAIFKCAEITGADEIDDSIIIKLGYMWSDKPFLQDQSNELGKYLLELLG